MAAPYRGRQQHVVPMTVEEKESSRDRKCGSISYVNKRFLK